MECSKNRGLVIHRYKFEHLFFSHYQLFQHVWCWYGMFGLFFFFLNCDLWPFSDTAIYSKIMKSCVHCGALEYHLEARVVTVHPSERESIPDLYRKSLFSVEKNVQTYMVKVLVLAGSFWIIVIQKMQRMNQCELTHCSPFFSYHTWLCSNGSSDTWYYNYVFVSLLTSHWRHDYMA